VSHDRARRLAHIDTLADERGSGLIFALLGVLVLFSLSALFVGNAVSQSQASAAQRDHESALHVAESGAETALSRASDNTDYATHDYGNYDKCDRSDERSWAIEKANAVPADELIATAEGEAAAIRPENSDDKPMPCVYGVGFVSERDDAEATRVVNVTVSQQAEETAGEPVLTKYALLAAGDLTAGAAVKGSPVHANGNLTAKGKLHECSTVQDCEGEPYVNVPNFTAREFWEMRNDVNYQGDFVELCPGGFAYAGAPSADAPCERPDQRPILPNKLPEATYSASAGEWRLEEGSLDGVYYVSESDVRVTKSNNGNDKSNNGNDKSNNGNDKSSPSTIIAEAATEDSATNLALGAGGTIFANVKVDQHAAWPGVKFIADVDLKVKGTSGQISPPALAYAHEQLRVRTSTDGLFYIACDESLASDALDPKAPCPTPDEDGQTNSRPNSPVHQSSTGPAIKTSARVTYDNAAGGPVVPPVAVDTVTGTLRWEELR
jgi:hypothetical protein